MDIVIGIGDYAISNRKEDRLKTFALASCVALIVYTPAKRVAGMIHIALPHSCDSEEARFRPYYYATHGIPLLISKFYTGYGCNQRELDIRLYGGAVSTRRDDYFQIGPRNVETVHKVLRELNLKVQEEQTGGTDSRSLVMDVADGTVQVIRQPLKI